MSIGAGVPLKTYHNNRTNTTESNNDSNNNNNNATCNGCVERSDVQCNKCLKPSNPPQHDEDIEDITWLTKNHKNCYINPPIVPSYNPYTVQLTVGKQYSYCTCGRSANQPWCDNSHKANDPQPIKFIINRSSTYYSLCGCKYSTKQPFCDGSHISVKQGTEQ
jgi:CDGSH-type Zn-finger protein